jgi:hypothetical protein
MSKIALITDCHYGIRNDSIAFLDMNKKFFDTIFFPYLENNNIDTIVNLGDLLDRRKYVNIYTAHRLIEDFITPTYKRNYAYHHILGNHDTHFKNTNKVNSVSKLIGDLYPIYHTATEITLYDTKILFVPWICQDNREETFEKIKSTNSQICFGHLELHGFEMFKGNFATHGDDSKIFNERFDITCSGHYHHKSSSSGIHYLGSHAQFTWSDYGDERGFHIFDTETRSLEFIKNPYDMFIKEIYDDSDTNLETLLDNNFQKFSGVMCKLIVKNKTNPYWFEMFQEKIEKSGVLDLQIIEDVITLNMENDNSEIETTNNTIDIFKSYVSEISGNVNKSKLIDFVTDLFNEANSIKL